MNEFILGPVSFDQLSPIIHRSTILPYLSPNNKLQVAIHLFIGMPNAVQDSRCYDRQAYIGPIYIFRANVK